ncbi:DUF86 domain-containing protein [Salegentibacter sp. JZCK2]|uniref:HepT-like ribonuclease domain-containing protein n=1 Tax=Salegentibacter tibetensis TaxID=2873600 RepID=UPI001CCF3194|nr:DUF86 domain-containing protein [Salegentibacter tibetensis]MBZ9729228.1 DUF86 domain-containing protein [Salegentibacter tibetensis]
MSKRDANLLLEDILEPIDKIQKYTVNLDFSAFQNDDKTVDAVIRNFEIIGEAANRLPEEFRKNNEEINGNRIRGFRNRIVHEYFGVDLSIVWSIIENNIKRS